MAVPALPGSRGAAVAVEPRSSPSGIVLAFAAARHRPREQASAYASYGSSSQPVLRPPRGGGGGRPSLPRPGSQGSQNMSLLCLNPPWCHPTWGKAVRTASKPPEWSLSPL